MARYCSRCGQPVEDHMGKGTSRVCPLKEGDKYPTPGQPVRLVFDPGKTDRKRRAREKAQKERRELESRQLGEVAELIDGLEK